MQIEMEFARVFSYAYHQIHEDLRELLEIDHEISKEQLKTYIKKEKIIS